MDYPGPRSAQKRCFQQKQPTIFNIKCPTNVRPPAIGNSSHMYADTSHRLYLCGL